MTQAPLTDAPARARIRGDLGTTLIVEAAAGTGKTTELVARIVALIRLGHTTLERILSVTFTELAAGEMKLRLRSELEKAREGSLLEEHDRLTAALGKLEVAPIGTIHSFCSDLLRERPVEARVDPIFEVAASEAQERLFNQAFEAWFQAVVAAPPEGVRRLLRQTLRRKDTPPRERLRSAGLTLSEHRDFDGAWRRDPFDRGAGLSRILGRLAEISAYAARAQRPEEWAAQSIAELSRFLQELQRREELHGRDEDGLEAELHELLGRRLWNWSGGGRSFAEGVTKQSVLALRDAVKAELAGFLDLCDADLAACLREELRPLCDSYEALKAHAGSLDFLDLLLKARDLVRDDALVRRELQDRFTHVLVDEFQDTDPLQAEILLLIAAADSSLSDWRRARPVAGKLFVVGDPKQSIYRFRRADIALYEDVKSLLLDGGAQLLHLTTSFRSVPDIQRAINAAFASQMTGGAQASYVALDESRAPIEGQPAVIALPAPGIYGKYDKVVNFRIEETYPDAVGGFIDYLIRKSGWRVSERDKPEPVPIGARHVCLLFKRYRGYSGDLTRPYVQALEARRIPHVLVGGRSYHDREEVLAVRAAIAAIECPDDELSVFATLRGPLFALSDDALLIFRMNQGRLHPLRRFEGALSPPELEVTQALSILGELHLRRNRRPIAETLTRLLDATRAHAGLAIWPTGEQALANVLRVVELSRRFESAGASSFRAFVDRLTADAESGEAGEAPVVEEGTEGVRIMSVHKAKGLEFPVVILCDPCATASPKMPSRLVIPERQIWAVPLAGCAPAELLEAREAVLARDREEAVRVAYVAATRARDLLVVPVIGDEALTGWLEPLGPALQPMPETRRQPRVAVGCPPFGKETVLDRPEGRSSALSVSPGLHRAQVGAQEVVWWDPATLGLGAEADGGLRSNELLVEDESSREAAQAATSAHAEWQARRARVLAQGAVPSLRLATVTGLAAETAKARAQAAPERVEPGRVARIPPEPRVEPERVEQDQPEPRVASERVEAIDPRRPRGRRFGTLVHAVLAEVPLHASSEEVLRSARAQGRAALANADEIAAAAQAVSAALAHPLLVRAAQSADCRRETAVLHRLEDGTLLEGVVDLAFREEGAEGPVWTVVDYKTDAHAEAHAAYAAQVQLSCAAISAATGERSRGVLLSV